MFGAAIVSGVRMQRTIIERTVMQLKKDLGLEWIQVSKGFGGKTYQQAQEWHRKGYTVLTDADGNHKLQKTHAV